MRRAVHVEHDRDAGETTVPFEGADDSAGVTVIVLPDFAVTSRIRSRSSRAYPRDPRRAREVDRVVVELPPETVVPTPAAVTVPLASNRA